MSDVDFPLLQAHLARCKAGYVSSLLVWPRYGHVPDNELDSNELDWIGLVVLFTDMHPRCMMGSKPFSSITGTEGRSLKTKRQSRPLADS